MLSAMNEQPGQPSSHGAPDFPGGGLPGSNMKLKMTTTIRQKISIEEIVSRLRNSERMSFQAMVKDMKEGLVVEEVIGAEQGNILGGDFGGNVLLGYKVENGEIVGRVKDTMIAGNVYQVSKELLAIGQEARWVGGALQAPPLYCSGVSVTTKGN